jgi:hypothetical protein
MKTRNGFVSNSSSSSFVIVASNDIINKAMAELTDFGKAVIKTEVLRRAKTAPINGINTVIAHGENSTEDWGNRAMEAMNISEDDCYEKSEEAQEQWHLFCEKVNQLGGYTADEC